MKILTENQQKTLDFCREFLTDNDQFPPSHVMADKFNINNHAVVCRMKGLEKKGLIKKNAVGKYMFSRELQ